MAEDDFRVHWLPIAVFIALPVTFLTSFAIAVGLGHVEAAFPYISDTGAQSPESCIFGQLLNIAAVLVGVNFYVRYKQVQYHLSQHDNKCLQQTNHVALYIGLSSALGMSVVGNFQETNVLVVHLIGAVFAFGVGWVYSVIQTFISYKTQPYLSSLLVCHIRVVLCVFIAITFAGTFGFAVVASKDYHGSGYPPEWLQTDGGYTYHVMSTASEWIMASCLLFFFVSFVSEFRHIRVTPPRVSVVDLTNSGLIADNDGDVPIIT